MSAELLKLALDALNSGDVLKRTRAVVEIEKVLSQPLVEVQEPSMSTCVDSADYEARLRAYYEARAIPPQMAVRFAEKSNGIGTTAPGGEEPK